MAEKEFRLDRNLEALVIAAGNSTFLKEESEIKVTTDLRKEAAKFYSNPQIRSFSYLNPDSLLGQADHVVQLDLETGESALYSNLNKFITDAMLNEAREFFLDKLDDSFKARYYAKMAERGMLPDAPASDAPEQDKEAYRKLAEARSLLVYSQTLENAIRSKDLLKAGQLVARQTGEREIILQLKIARGSGDQNKEYALYDSISKVNRKYAEAIIRENKLYSMIDKGIAKHKQEKGKAYALVGLYNTYAEQQLQEREVREQAPAQREETPQGEEVEVELER